MNKKSLIIILLVLVVATIAATAHIFKIAGEQAAGFDYSVIKEVGNPDAVAPAIQAEGAEIYCTNINSPVYQKNANERIDPYSITKILTCYLALETQDIERKVTVSQYASTPLEDGTTIYLQEGEIISIKDLLYGTLLESGNDAATALGEAVAGSEKDFADLMNETAAEWGCQNTHFVNANGWKDEDHYTTAHDMAVIGANVFKNKMLREISMTKEYTIEATNMSDERYLKNHFLSGSKLEYATCGKAGRWTSDDASLVVGFNKNGLEGSIAVLRTKSLTRKKDVRKLINFSQEVTPGYVLEAGTEIMEIRVKGGEKRKTMLCLEDTVYAYPMNHDVTGIHLETNVDCINAPVVKGEELGEIVVYVDGKKKYNGKLLASEDIPQ